MQETPRKGSETRERLLDVAEAAVLEKGFAATSIEEVIAAVGITKSGFFYHFRDKNELAKALLGRLTDTLLLDSAFASPGRYAGEIVRRLRLLMPSAPKVWMAMASRPGTSAYSMPRPMWTACCAPRREPAHDLGEARVL